MKLKKLLLLPVYLLTVILLLFIAVAIYPYIFTNIYKFPNFKPFAGNDWYNPYADTSGKWLKANFHAHAKAWGGLTSGKLSESQLDSVYKGMRYDFIGVSNYYKISNIPGTKKEEFIPLYEHGINIWKRHQHPIAAKEVVYFDYPLFQTIHHKQDIIERLRSSSKLLAINHPEFLESYEIDDFQYLSNYTHIEILNHYRTSLAHWDMALTSGYPAFAYGNDDSHDQTNKNETGRFWTMVRSTSLLSDLMLDALKKGNTIAVSGENGEVDNELRFLKVESDTLRMKMTAPADSIIVIGNFGVTSNKITKSDSLVLPVKNFKTYLRIEVFNPKTVFYLNPIIRIDGSLPTYKPTKNAAFSFLVRIVAITFYAFFIIFIYRFIKRIYKNITDKEVVRIV
jgi:ABC-type sugar transport system permease subunit